MWNKAKIMWQAERALKRTEAYRENRSDSSGREDNFHLEYVLVKGSKPTPDTAIAYAHYEDQLISFNPLESGGNSKIVWDWAFSFDGDLFLYLEQGYELVGMTVETHSLVWEEIEEHHSDGGICSPGGMQKYLNYCKRNGVTAELLRKEQDYGGMDVMQLYNKSAFKEKPSQEQER
ncbi:MAG: hypothetical protein LUG44_05185 [Clostridiales bacterium]|nr:hypothetical protein [Clostridiales bacterium]